MVEAQEAWIFDERDAEAEIEARAQARFSRKRVEHRSALDVGRDDWETPEPLLERVREIAPIALDPCTTDKNPTKAMRYFTKESDGLKQEWNEPGLVFVNFPYSDAQRWAVKTVNEARRCGHTVVLPAARPGAKFYRTIQKHCAVYLEVEGRIKFVGASSGAPFPSAVFYFGKDLDAFCRAFRDLGQLLERA